MSWITDFEKTFVMRSDYYDDETDSDEEDKDYEYYVEDNDVDDPRTYSLDEYYKKLLEQHLQKISFEDFKKKGIIRPYANKSCKTNVMLCKWMNGIYYPITFINRTKMTSST